ncbi:helix-turn-helix domain-containing protein [Chryseobacterium oryctis]|uniref:Helix-turn-helix domain-containing protein n=1 Tax=Chryseobacterium oryctis TaxID=2952618 RepID=A0ABT3HM37_9FLAO|nr:helix-turn-helix domain-containing protein [Chryseobacterium oryctis]MCW3160842.1 helix-turn-helix domain-containing protein [Chryseobacterium oryctis]
MKNLSPNYKLIYEDMISRKYPHKKSDCESILKKKKLTILDIIKLNNIIVNGADEDGRVLNQRLRSYDKKTILKILHYQKENKLNNTELANEFKLSRNTISKWKKNF